MNKNNSCSPVNLAFTSPFGNLNNYSDVLPPFPHNFSGEHKSEDFCNLKDFRSKMFTMDEEIKQLKNIEIEKQLHNNGNIEVRPSKIEVHEVNEQSTKNLIQEQNKRIIELHEQLEQLKSMSSSSKDIGIETDKNNEYSENNFSKQLDNDEITRRICNWSARDPYQGPMENLYFPFGSAGGGAPNRDSFGNAKTTISGQTTLYSTTEEKKRKILASQIMLESLKHEMLEQKLRRLRDKQQIREPQRNLLEFISNFQVGRPKRDPNTGILLDNHLNSSDITNNKLHTTRAHSPVKNNEIQTIQDDNIYHNYGIDLHRAAEERQIFKKLSKLKEQQEVRQHIDSWDQIWGRQIKPYSLTSLNDLKSYPIQSNRSNHRNFYQLSD